MLEDQEDMISSIINSYFDPGTWQVEARENGVNNTTRLVVHRSGQYNLRIYENHADSEKISYETKVLGELASVSLPFKTPVVQPTRTGDPFFRTDNGKLAVLFHWIEGIRAEPGHQEHTEAIGQAIAEVVNSLAAITIPLPPAYEPYYDLSQIHPLVTPEKLKNWMEGHKQGSMKEEALLLEEELARLHNSLPLLKQLPMQLVHSDIVYGNIIMGPDATVSGILDFEFVTMDLRAMELAVYMAELVTWNGEPQVWGELRACLRGYGKKGRLTKEEHAALPQLILLRRLVVVLHFLGRYWAGVDAEEPTRYLRAFADACRWFNSHQSQLMELIEENIPMERGRIQ